MTPLTYKEKEQNKAKLAEIEDFDVKDGSAKRYKVEDLRELARSVGESRVIQNGKDIPVAKARRQTLIDLLERIKEDYLRLQSASTTVQKTEFDFDGEFIEHLCQSAWLDIRNAIPRLQGTDGKWISPWSPKDAYGNENLFLKSTEKVINSLQNYVSPKTEKPYSPSSILWVLTNRLKPYIHKKIDESQHQHWHEYAKENIEVWYIKIRNDARVLSKLVKKEGEKSFTVRENNRYIINPKPLVDWSVAVLQDVENQGWKYLSIALAALSGRRQVEIHTTSEHTGGPVFTPSDIPGHVKFSNQAKVKGSTQKYWEENPSYDIPVLCDPDLFLKAYNVFYKRHSDPQGKETQVIWSENVGGSTPQRMVNKIVNAKLSGVKKKKRKDGTYSERESVIKTVAKSFVEIWNKETGDRVDISTCPFGTKRTGFHYHHLRQIYALLAYYDFGSGDQTRWVSQTLGHDGGLKDGIKSTAMRYEADFELSSEHYPIKSVALK